MSEFEKCPITGDLPLWFSANGGFLRFDSPFEDDAEFFEVPGISKSAAIEWWNEKYVPSIRKLADQQEPELQVGDVVTLGLSGIEWLAEFRHEVKNATATIQSFEIHGESGRNAILNRPIVGHNSVITVRYLRLISRPKKLTVADLPEIDGLSWVADYHHENCVAFESLVLLDGAGGRAAKFNTPSEHEAVTAALEFCQKIADGMKGREVGDE